MKVQHNKIINDIIEELVGNAYENMISDNEEIREMENKLCAQGEKIQCVLFNLDDKDREIIEDYMEQVEIVNGEYNNKIYVQGLKDCIRAMKYFKVM